MVACILYAIGTFGRTNTSFCAAEQRQAFSPIAKFRKRLVTHLSGVELAVLRANYQACGRLEAT
jgi:hypothetical protein